MRPDRETLGRWGTLAALAGAYAFACAVVFAAGVLLAWSLIYAAYLFHGPEWRAVGGLAGSAGGILMVAAYARSWRWAALWTAVAVAVGAAVDHGLALPPRTTRLCLVAIGSLGAFGAGYLGLVAYVVASSSRPQRRSVGGVSAPTSTWDASATPTP